MDRYRKERVIGKGAFGSALLVSDRFSAKQYVIKQVDVSKMGQKERDDAKKEVKLLGSFKHPNIVRYRESFIDQGMLCIVMDYADGGTL
ncbi:NIMA-related kinase 1, partial [Pavlovales sp. CCMP2436]